MSLIWKIKCRHITFAPRLLVNLSAFVCLPPSFFWTFHAKAESIYRITNKEHGILNFEVRHSVFLVRYSIISFLITKIDRPRKTYQYKQQTTHNDPPFNK